MVEIERKSLEKTLKVMTSAIKQRVEPVLGRFDGQQLHLWQGTPIRIWQSFPVDYDNTFDFSVSTKDFYSVINKIKSNAVSIMTNDRRGIIIKAGGSILKLPQVIGLEETIPTPPTIPQCCVDKAFISTLLQSNEFTLTKFDTNGFMNSYIGERDGYLLIAGSGHFYSYSSYIPYKGFAPDELLIPNVLTDMVSPLFSKSDALNIGKSELGDIVFSDNDNLITVSMPSIRGNYSLFFESLFTREGKPLFTVSTNCLIECLKLAETVSTKGERVGIEGHNGKLRIILSDYSIDADLYVDEVVVVENFTVKWFLLSYLVKCLNVFRKKEITAFEVSEQILRIVSDERWTATHIRQLSSQQS